MTIAQKPPIHLWVVGIASLLWNSIGALDYSMSQLRNEQYLAMAGIPVDDMIAWIEAFPWWVHASWALGVWGAFAGSVLLLMRSRHAVTAFGISLVAVFVNKLGGRLSGVETPMELTGTGHTFFEIAIMAIAILLFIYARKQRANGVLV